MREATNLLPCGPSRHANEQLGRFALLNYESVFRTMGSLLLQQILTANVTHGFTD
jgi:hypothetical protein